jgi:hypothetical protein
MESFTFLLTNSIIDFKYGDMVIVKVKNGKRGVITHMTEKTIEKYVPAYCGKIPGVIKIETKFLDRVDPDNLEVKNMPYEETDNLV